jgi:OOP family OmpA-OmpF porin
MWLNKLKYILAASALVVSVQARVINVPSDYKKIADALGNADSGDTIKVKRGVYNENITLVQGVVLMGENPLTTILDGGRDGATVNGVADGEIQGFTIRNGIEGVLCENAPAKVIGNWVIDNHATGIAAFISLPMVRNNVVWGNRWSGILAWGAKAYDAKVEHNVILRNGYSGITLMGPTNIQIQNNILMENHYYGIFAEPASGQTKVDFNNIYQNYYPFNAFVKVPRTNPSVEPKFINPSLSKPNMFVATKSRLKNRGKQGRDIGLVEKDVIIPESDGDKDKDGIMDSEDTCPNDPEDQDGFQDLDGCPEKDNDADGVSDINDKCPMQAEDKDGFEDKDGCPEADNDNDGFLDADDRCPEMPETKNGFKDDDGCPDKEPVAPKKTFTLSGISFKPGSSQITPASEEVLYDVRDQLEAFPKAKFRIEGHTDGQGPAKANKRLSKARANSVKTWLIEKGIASNRLTSKGMGEVKPIASNKTAAGREKNRRIEFYRTN